MVNPALEKQIGIYSVHTRNMKIDQVQESSRLRAFRGNWGHEGFSIFQSLKPPRGVPSGAEAFIPMILGGQSPRISKISFFRR